MSFGTFGVRAFLLLNGEETFYPFFRIEIVTFWLPLGLLSLGTRLYSILRTHTPPGSLLALLDVFSWLLSIGDSEFFILLVNVGVYLFR